MESNWLKDAREEKARNSRQRIDFVKFWANYVKANPNEVWSAQQAKLINGQTGEGMTLEAYLKMERARAIRHG